jgi:hypothetical protein
MASNLSSLFRDAKQVGIMEEMTTYKVLRDYLKDCYGYALTSEIANTLTTVPTLCRNGGEAGVFITENEKTNFYPVTEGFKDYLSVIPQNNKEGKAYLTLEYSADPELKGDSSYRIPSLFGNVSDRSVKPVWNKALSGQDLAELFYPGAPNSLTADGDYTAKEVVVLSNDSYRLVTDLFSVVLNAEKVVAVGGAVTLKDAELKVKQGVAFLNDIQVSGGDSLEILSIPAEKGFIIDCVKYETRGNNGAAIVSTKEGITYWAPLAAKKFFTAIHPVIPPSFKIEVVSINTKGDKEYPEVKITMN